MSETQIDQLKTACSAALPPGVEWQAIVINPDGPPIALNIYPADPDLRDSRSMVAAAGQALSPILAAWGCTATQLDSEWRGRYSSSLFIPLI